MTTDDGGDGLGRWLDEVVFLHARARTALRVEVVHDLRVAIRRCRSLAQGLREVDDDEGAVRWKALSDAGRGLFQGLGELRDAQVMQEHIDAKLADDPAHEGIQKAVDSRIRALKDGARAAVLTFDVDAWRAAAVELPARARALLVQRPLFDHLALRRFFEARELHQQAMRSRTSTALHELRIGVKKLRYTIENFLPAAHDEVGKPLKKMQEVLGDIHDLDVLIATLAGEHMRLHSEDRSRVTSLVRGHRDARVADYRALALGPDGAWPRIRTALVDGPAVARAHEALMKRRAHGRGGTVLEVRGLERAVQVLLHAFRKRLPALRDPRIEGLLRWASVCARVDGGGKGARRFVGRLPRALGFADREHALLAVVSSCGARRVPSLDDPRVAALLARDRPVAVACGALMHVAWPLARTTFVVQESAEVISIVLAAQPVTPRFLEDFASRRAPLEALVGKPLWWRAQG